MSGVGPHSASRVDNKNAPSSFVNKPARGWLHPDNLIAKVGSYFLPILNLLSMVYFYEGD